MHLANPLRSLSPTVDADVLAVLARSHGPLTGGRVQALSGRSYSQVRAVLHRLVVAGLVSAERHGNAVSYLLNRNHVMAGPMAELLGSDDAVEARVSSAVSGWEPGAVAVVLFGSFARRDGDEESDIDLLVVRPDTVAREDPSWEASRYDLARDIERWTGNTTQVVELSETGLAEAVQRGDPLVEELRRDGRVVHGPDLKRLLAVRAGESGR